ncbi:hypothetical protein PGSY75_0216900 [Plasmodium gaboni]|uniref:Uncharacterized protein n=1 Tax=Plasmodium gaboni TaxID=647221 RepID=A0A151LWN2_9APIC|nr:hypothetical protein PGSY75_0216900 [Plasmodium gaboni]KYO03599.1 hypothetical protein PGSY75_0216900 [Plasmodium gaboni]
MEEKKKINSKSNNVLTNDDKNKEKRKKLKPIQVRRSIKDIIIECNPYDYIYNYKGYDINIFDNNNKEDDIIKKKDRSDEIKKNSSIFIENEMLDNNEKLMRKELNELINKKDLSEDMKNDIRALYIEVQEIYLILKNDINKNIPSSDEIIKLYLSEEKKDKSTNIIWKRFCFYKLLSDKLNDLHISTISSYRHEYLKTIYIWYQKNKKLLFKETEKKEVFGDKKNERNKKNERDNKNRSDDDNNNSDDNDNNNNSDNNNNNTSNNNNNNNNNTSNNNNNNNTSNNNYNSDEKNIIDQNEIIKNKDPLNCHSTKEETEKKMKKNNTKNISHNFEILQEEMNKIKKEHEIEERELPFLLSDEESHDMFNKYIYPNDICLLNNKKLNDLNVKNMQQENNDENKDLNVLLLRNNKDEEDTNTKIICEHISLDNFINNNNNMININNCKLDIKEEDKNLYTPLHTNKIKELEEEINKQKLLIKKKEIEIINSPIGIKFKDIFGNFQDINN